MIQVLSSFYTTFKVVKRLIPLFVVLFSGCIVPEEPKFDFKEGLIYIDALAATTAGTSYVSISESVVKLDAYRNEFIGGATVFFRNTENGLMVELSEENGIYLPPIDFVVSVGEIWELNIVLPDGKRYISQSEKVLKPVTFSNLKVAYDPELTFKEDLDRFVPGHSISIDLNDPADEQNYYLWKYRSFEKLLICETCENQIFRDGKCIDVENDPNEGLENLGEADYYCEGDCWRIRYNESIELFSDEFTQGGFVGSLPVGDIPLYTTENIVLELQQISLTESMYDYYKILNDIVDNNSGLNAPPPAALVGNIFNPEDEEEYVLGRFTAASSTTMSIFIERESISEAPIDTFNFFKSECQIFCGITICNSPESCAFESTTPCTETRFRTAIKPEGWID